MNIFLDVGQDFYTVVPEYEKLTLSQIFILLTECGKSSGEMTIISSESEKRVAGWGHLIYRVGDDGHLTLIAHNVDSSG